MKSRSRSSNFFSSVARSRRTVAAGVPAFLLAAAIALGVSAVPARAANVTVYESDGTTERASGDSLGDVAASVQNGDVVEFSSGRVSGGSLSFTGDTTLTLQSAVAGTQVEASGISVDTGALTLNLKDLSLTSYATNPFAQTSWDGIRIVGDNATIQNCASSNRGGAVFADVGDVAVSSTTTFSNNKAQSNVWGSGGAILAYAGNVSVSGTTTFTNNKTTQPNGVSYGGAICAIRTFVMFPSGLFGDVGGDVTVSGETLFSGNKAATAGGAIFAYRNVLVSGKTTFENNTAATAGGAIYAEGYVKFWGDGSESTFSGNTADGEANDLRALYVVITDAGTYSFGGGVELVPSSGAGGTLEISGGAQVTFTGGAVNYVGGTATVKGAETTAKFENAGAASNTFDGGFKLLDGATVELSGSGVTLNVKNWTDDATSALTLGAGTKLALTSDSSATTIRSALTLDGDLDAGTDALTLAGTTNAGGEIVAGTLAVSGTATLSGAVSAGATEVSGTLTLDGAAGVSRELGNVTMSSGGMFEVNTDATADVVFAADSTGATVSVSGATLTGNVTLSGDATNALNLSNATIAGTLTATGGTLSLDGENAADRVRIGSGAVVTQTEGATLSATAVDVVDSTFVLERGASIGAAVYVESGRAEIAGTIANHLELTNGSTLTASADSTVRSLYAENSSVNLAGEAETVRVVRDENAAEDLAASEISGSVSGRLSVVNAEATLSGSAANVSVAGSGANFTQTADGAISGTLDASHGATATLAGTVSKIRINAFDQNAAEEGTTTVTLEAAGTTLEALEIHGDALLTAKTGEGEGTTWNALEVTTAIADGAGKIKGGDVTLNGLSGTTAVTAMGTLTLNGATRTSGDVVANGKLVISSGAEATLSGQVGAGEARIDGTLTLTGTDWEQSDGLGALISVGENGAFVVDYIAASTIRVDSASTISLKNGAWLSAALSFKTKTLELSGGAKLHNAFRNEDQTLEVVEKIEDGDGTIEGGTVTLHGGVSGNVNVSAMKDLNLGGETKTTGTLSADTIRLLSDAALTADFSKVSVGESLTVNMDATATLTIDTAGAVVDKLQVDGAVTLTGGNAFSLETLRGSGTVEKTGAGALTLGASADFAGTLKISAGAATLSAGATFGGSLGFFSENETLTAHDGATIAGTLTLGSGTTLELGGHDAKATVSVGALVQGGASAQAFSLRARNASAGTTTIVHDVYSANEYDVLRVGSGADLSFATALLRAGTGLDVNALAAAPDGVTLTLVEGDVAHGYGALVLADEFDLVNIALSADGTTASAGLGAAALAAGVFPLETTSAQRATAQAATLAGTASGYGAALNALTNPHDTLAALDALGAAHAASMMPAQIDGAWNRLRGVMNAAGTGARLGAETELAAWAQYAGSWTDVDASRERASWTRRMHGAHVGVEGAFASGWTAGAALGYEDSEQKVGGAKIADDALSASFYARREEGPLTQTAALSFARHDYETRRAVAFPGYAGRTRGDTLGFTAALSYEASYAFAVADWAKVSPVASLSAAWNTIEGWTESGADAALRIGDQDALTWLAGAGARADFEFANPFTDAAKARVGAYALFTAEFGERSCGVDASFADTGEGFRQGYDDPSRYALQLGATASLPLSGNTALFGGVSTELREDETNLNANVGVRFTW
ncbi:autotransporter domain-containing protein [Candidatus Spyradosoma sp. SGI.093]|uniref:autotransporter domain-containing protein n=1 Tax=Candidatus Spyradosoma sp. SGI.093 TaxID=3420583 RepID=UPI003D0352BD